MTRLRHYPYIRLKYINGMRNVENSSEFVRRENEVIVIRGQPACPECHSLLYRDAAIYWHCTGCGCVWTAAELVEAIEAEDKAMRSRVTIRGLID